MRKIIGPVSGVNLDRDKIEFVEAIADWIAELLFQFFAFRFVRGPKVMTTEFAATLDPASTKKNSFPAVCNGNVSTKNRDVRDKNRENPIPKKNSISMVTELKLQVD